MGFSPPENSLLPFGSTSAGIAAILFLYFSKTDFIAIDMDGKPRKALRGDVEDRVSGIY